MSDYRYIVRFKFYNANNELKYACSSFYGDDKPTDADLDQLIEDTRRDYNLVRTEGGIEILRMPSPEKRARECAEERAKLRPMGADYPIYDFEDFELGLELENLLDSGEEADPDAKVLDARKAGVIAAIKEAFDKMRTEGRWSMSWSSNVFMWTPDIWVDFWHDNFPFTLDLRPSDIMPCVEHEVGLVIQDDMEEDEDDDRLEILEAQLATWRAAFDQALAYVAQQRILPT